MIDNTAAKKRIKLDIPTGITLTNEVVSAHITGPAEGQAGVLSVRWEIRDQRRCIARALKPRTPKYNPKTETWGHALRIMVALAKEAFQLEYETFSAAESVTEPTDGKFTMLYHKFVENNIEAYCLLTWRKENTKRQYFAAFRRFCTMLDNFEGKIDLEAISEIRAKWIEEAAKNPRSKGAAKAAEHIDKMLVSCSYIYASLVETVNTSGLGFTLPVLPIYDVIRSCKGMQEEQIKWLPAPILVKLVDALFRNIHNGLVMGVALMLIYGLRTGEACAPIFHELKMHTWPDGAMVTYNVCTQGPDRSPLLKSWAAYRIVIAGQLLYDLIDCRKHYLESKGYSDEQIDAMPVTASEDDPTRAANADQLSAFARALLIDCGLDIATVLIIMKQMIEYPDYEADGSVMYSISAYILRRNYATMLSNVCDIAPGSYVEDVLLGHALPRGVKLPIDLQNADMQRVLAAKMERLVLHPEHTANPWHRCVRLGVHAAYDMRTHVAYTFEATRDLEVEIMVETREPNGTITVSSSHGIRKKDFQLTPGTLDVPGVRAHRDIALMPPSPEMFCVWLNQCENPNIDNQEK